MMQSAGVEEKNIVQALKTGCRFCASDLGEPFLDLGRMPLANSYLKQQDLDKKERSYPLRVFLCPSCSLVQLADLNQSDDIFNDEYAYFSSYSDSWLRHAKQYAEMAVSRFKLNESSLVIELASNDGYLLQFFKEKNIPVLGIEPSGNTAAVAMRKGIPTYVKFFGWKTADELVLKGTQADLLVGNNVLAHVPPLNDFIAGMKKVLKPQGVITMEFPHLMQLIERNQFDTVYHEHFSYYTLAVVENIFSAHGLKVFDVEQLKSHGGSLRVFACHAENESLEVSPAVVELRKREHSGGYLTADLYRRFSHKVERTKAALLRFFSDVRAQGKTVACYGAPAKGNTLLNYCGITAEDVLFTVDRSPHKQNLFLPGSRIPVYAPDKIREARPDYVLILPWNLREEIQQQMSFIREWGGKFAVPIPELEIW